MKIACSSWISSYSRICHRLCNQNELTSNDYGGTKELKLYSSGIQSKSALFPNQISISLFLNLPKNSSSTLSLQFGEHPNPKKKKQFFFVVLHCLEFSVKFSVTKFCGSSSCSCFFVAGKGVGEAKKGVGSVEKWASYAITFLGNRRRNYHIGA